MWLWANGRRISHFCNVFKAILQGLSNLKTTFQRVTNEVYTLIHLNVFDIKAGLMVWSNYLKSHLLQRMQKRPSQGIRVVQNPLSYAPWNQHNTWKWMVGILVSFWDGLLSGAMLVSGSVIHLCVTYSFDIIRCPMLRNMSSQLSLQVTLLHPLPCGNLGKP